MRTAQQHKREHDDDDAKAITIAEWSQNEKFARLVLDDGKWKHDGKPIRNADLVVLHCTDCGRRLVIDGVHRMVWLGHNKVSNALLNVRQLSGSGWRRETPDMGRRVCNCSRSRDDATGVTP